MGNFFLSGSLLLVTVVWGWTFVVVRDAVTAYSVLGFLALRFTIASLCLGPFSFKRLTRGTFVPGAGIGICLAGGYLLQTYGLRHTTPTNSGLITGLFVVFAPVASYILFRVRIDRVLLLPLGTCLVGTLLLVGGSPEAIRIGDGLTLGCAACFGLHIALLSHYAHRHDATALALAQMVATRCYADYHGCSLKAPRSHPYMYGSLCLSQAYSLPPPLSPYRHTFSNACLQPELLLS